MNSRPKVNKEDIERLISEKVLSRYDRCHFCGSKDRTRDDSHPDSELENRYLIKACEAFEVDVKSFIKELIIYNCDSCKTLYWTL